MINVDSLSSQAIGKLEQTTHQLLLTMRKVKFHSDPLYIALQILEQELADTRCNRFDRDTSEFQGY